MIYKLDVTREEKFSFLVEADSLEESKKKFWDREYEEVKKDHGQTLNNKESFLWGYSIDGAEGSMWISGSKEVGTDEGPSQFYIIR